MAIMATNSLDGSYKYRWLVTMIAGGEINLSAVEAVIIKQYAWLSDVSITNYHEITKSVYELNSDRAVFL